MIDLRGRCFVSERPLWIRLSCLEVSYERRLTFRSYRRFNLAPTSLPHYGISVCVREQVGSTGPLSLGECFRGFRPGTRIDSQDVMLSTNNGIQLKESASAFYSIFLVVQFPLRSVFFFFCWQSLLTKSLSDHLFQSRSVAFFPFVCSRLLSHCCGITSTFSNYHLGTEGSLC